METCINQPISITQFFLKILMLLPHEVLLYKLKKQMYYLIRSLLHNRRGKVALSAKLPIRNTTELAIRNSFFLIYVKYLSEGLESDSKHFLI